MAAQIGDAIKQSVAESLKNLDPVSIMQKIVATSPEDEESEEIRAKLEGVLQKYYEMSDEDKEAFMDQMKGLLASKVTAKLNDQNLNLNVEGIQEAIGQAVLYRLVFLGVCVLFLVVLFVFFGYKLYKSIKDKEIKREEKKKLKQMKKKK